MRWTQPRRWVADDVGSPKPLEYVGDLTARSGDVASAPSVIYDSVAEVDAEKAKLHERLAAMHQAKGAREAACAHLRSAMELSDRCQAHPKAVSALAKCEAAPADKEPAPGKARATGDLVVELDLVRRYGSRRWQWCPPEGRAPGCAQVHTRRGGGEGLPQWRFRRQAELLRARRLRQRSLSDLGDCGRWSR